MISPLALFAHLFVLVDPCVAGFWHVVRNLLFVKLTKPNVKEGSFVAIFGQKGPHTIFITFFENFFNLSVIPNAKYVRNVSFSENFANINYSILRVHPFST